MNSLQAIHSFITVVEEGSISAAANRLGLTAAAVSKRLQLLENNLGTRLLTRNTRHIALTEAGDYYFHHNKSLLAEIERIDKHVQDIQGVLKGRLHINMPMTYGKTRLTSIISQFLMIYPDIHINLKLDDAKIDVNQGEYDLVIRIGVLEDSELIARKLEDIQLITVASSDYLQKHGYPETPNDLIEHNCLNYTNDEQPDIWRYYDAAGYEYKIRTQGSMSCNSGEALKIACLAGLGIAMLPNFTMQSELDEGRLLPLFNEYCSQPISAYAIYPSRRYLPEKTRALLNFLIKQLNESHKN